MRPANVFSSVDLPGAVRTHDGVALAAADLQREVLDDRLRRISDGEPVRRQRDGAGARAAVEVELGQRLIRLRPIQLVDLVEHLPARLGLLRLLPGQVAADEVLRVGDVLLLPLVVLGHLLHPLAAELEELLVVAVVLDELSVRELDDLRDGPVEKRPVVRDQQVAALEALQELLEELDAFEVEMVGRLVEQQQVDLRQQDAREHGPVLLAAAEFVNGAVPLRFVTEPDTAEDALHLGVQRVAVRVLVVVLQLGVFVQQPLMLGLAFRRVREIVLDGAHLPLDAQHLGECGLDEIEQRHPRLGVEVLSDMADGHAVRADDLPVIGLFLLQEQAEDRGLAGAVAADEPDVLAGVVLPRDALEDVMRAVTFLDVVEPIEHCAGTQRTSARKCSGRHGRQRWLA